MERSVNGKIKIYRNLKVLFYCLGLPLFVLAVIMTATWLFAGEDPFMGSSGSTAAIWFQNQVTGSGVYGIWIALGIWVFVGVVQLIVRKTVGNRRARTVIVAVVALFAMAVPLVVMDIVLPMNLAAIEASAPEGVTIKSYGLQLSDLVGKTGSPIGDAHSFIDQIGSVTSAYNIGYSDSTKSGLADNTSNIPVTYESLYNVDENGYVIDKLSPERIVELKKQYGDGTGTDHDFVRVPPNADGKLEIDGVVYENYTSASYSPSIPGATEGSEMSSYKIFRWYKTSRNSEYKEGVYGMASYNANGLLSDGYVYGIDTALEVLRQYYYSQMKISELGGSDDVYSKIYAKALELQEADYSVEGTEKYEIWHNYVKMGGSGGTEEGFSMTIGKLTQLLNSVGSHIGNNAVIGALLGTVAEIAGGSLSFDIAGFGKIAIVNVTEANRDQYGGATVDLGLLVQIVPTGAEPSNIQLNANILNALGDLLDGLVKSGVIPVDTGGLSIGAWLYDLLNNYKLLDLIGIGDILGLFGLDLSSLFVGVTEDMTTGEVLETIVLNLLGGLYWYCDPEIVPVYDYYEAAAESLGYSTELASYYCMLDKAVYCGGWHGYMIGSTLIPGVSLIAGDNIGSGMPSSMGLGSYSAVVQLQADLQYKPAYYPLYSVRNLILAFLPVVLFCLIASGMAAEKEWLLETGQDDVPAKKKKVKKADKAAAKAEAALPAVEEEFSKPEETETPVERTEASVEPAADIVGEPTVQPEAEEALPAVEEELSKPEETDAPVERTEASVEPAADIVGEPTVQPEAEEGTETLAEENNGKEVE